MRTDRVAAFGTAATIVLLVLATGPQVGLLSIPEEGLAGGPAPGSGSATVSVIDAPDRAELAAGRYGDVHYLSVPPTTVRTSNVTGAPLLTASIEVEALGFSRSSVYTLQPEGPATRTVSIERAALEAATVDEATYDGRLRLVVRDDSGSETIYDEPVAVEVSG